MSCNCAHNALSDVFGERTARLDARRFRRSGPSARAARLIDALRDATTFHEATSLEGGAGVGALSIELVRRGVARATAVDAIPAAVRTARDLAREYGIGARFEAVIADFTELGDGPAYDIVVLDRVVCCYPDWEALLTTASARSRRIIGLSYPRAAWWTRTFVTLANAGLRLIRRRFRMYVHSPAIMHAWLAAHGFEPRVVGHVGSWELCVASRRGIVREDVEPG